MTDGSVAISITIKLEDVVMEIQEKVPIDAVEESIHSLATGFGQQVLHGVIHVLDDRIAQNVPAGWRNVGTEMRWMVSNLGAVSYPRRVYQDEQGRRRKPINELFGLTRYGLDYQVIYTSLVYYLWVVLPLAVVLLGWFVEQIKVRKITFAT